MMRLTVFFVYLSLSLLLPRFLSRSSFVCALPVSTCASAATFRLHPRSGVFSMARRPFTQSEHWSYNLDADRKPRSSTPQCSVTVYSLRKDNSKGTHSIMWSIPCGEEFEVQYEYSGKNEPKLNLIVNAAHQKLKRRVATREKSSGTGTPIGKHESRHPSGGTEQEMIAMSRQASNAIEASEQPP